uniref:BZIP domain-containing protein n=2 Tax=Macrostomum lignano TaxID=282301 RepID=A0A1I8GSQ7_9PLAT
ASLAAHRPRASTLSEASPGKQLLNPVGESAELSATLVSCCPSMANHPRYADDDDGWMDPNLVEPKLQDDLNRQLGLNRRVRQRPRAAFGSKSAPDPRQQRRQTELTQIRYFKYVPFTGMSEPEKQRYLSLGPARLTSSRTAPPTQPVVADKATEASYWSSASPSKSLKVYDYHLAELSMTYRSPPSLLELPRRELATPSASPRPPQQQQRQAALTAAPRRPLFFQLHSSRAVPASAPSATQQELQTSQRHATDVAEKTTQVSRGGTPFIDSALSDYPTEPMDLVSKSDSNRLLNVVSVDECHMRHRRRRRRLRRVHPSREATEADGEAWENKAPEEGYDEEEYDEDEEEDGAEWEATVEAVDAGDKPATGDAAPDATEFRQELRQESVEPHEQRAPESASATAVATVEPTVAPSVTATRPTTERSGGGRKKRRTEKELRRIAAAKFLRRNEILREKMTIYLDWKLNQERLGLIQLRLGDPAARFERFTEELVQQEAMVAGQYREPADDIGGNADAQGESPQLLESQNRPVNLASSKKRASATAGSPQQRQELSLTEMYEALRA